MLLEDAACLLERGAFRSSDEIFASHEVGDWTLVILR
jgi:hypothetical protein